jgi:hypothetical protein
VPIELSTDLPQPLVPLAWLIGRWAGAGVVGYPGVEESQVGQEIEFSHDSRPFLSYRSRSWLLDQAGNQVRPLATETGFWRVPNPPAQDGSADLEVLLAHPTGYVELYYGTVRGPRIDLATDAVVRTATAKEYTGATRMYGLVEGDLLWVMDMAAVGHPLQSHVSVRLKRT